MAVGVADIAKLVRMESLNVEFCDGKEVNKDVYCDMGTPLFAFFRMASRYFRTTSITARLACSSVVPGLTRMCICMSSTFPFAMVQFTDPLSLYHFSTAKLKSFGSIA